MAGGHTDEFNVVADIQRLYEFERGDRSPTGNGVPALFESQCGPHVRIILSRRRQ